MFNMRSIWLLVTLSYVSGALYMFSGADAKKLPSRFSKLNVTGDDELSFPESFKFGCATAAYQIEGAWNISGKGESIWDHSLHNHPEVILDRSNGDVSVDSYHFYKDDVMALKEMGMDRYRFSISWPRVLPTGEISSINEAGIAYYVSLVDELLANGIEPMVTLYHWDLPQYLQDLGGWANPVIVDYFEEYARLMFTRLGSKVKLWITFNEPKVFCSLSYETYFPVSLNNSGVGSYLCSQHVLLSHARAYRLYNETFKEEYGGKVSITLDSDWFEPATNASGDIQAAERGIQFSLGWFAHPIYTTTGGYPDVMVERIDANSKAEGRAWSRLPAIDEATKKYIRGTFDFFGLNHYTTNLVTPGVFGLNPSWSRDQETNRFFDPTWPGSSDWLKVVPWGLGNLLRWIKKEYNNPEVIITENGFVDQGELNDVDRVSYYTKYLNEVLKAMFEDGCNVTGYTAWSLVDNFEWTSGYTEKLGLYYVDMKDPLKKRVPKLSSTVMKEIIQTRKIPQKYLKL